MSSTLAVYNLVVVCRECPVQTALENVASQLNLLILSCYIIIHTLVPPDAHSHEAYMNASSSLILIKQHCGQ